MKYTTIQGDTWDLIAKKVYGDETKAQLLMEKNRALLDTLIFSAGVVLECPEIEQRSVTPDSYPVWRT